MSQGFKNQFMVCHVFYFSLRCDQQCSRRELFHQPESWSDDDIVRNRGMCSMSEKQPFCDVPLRFKVIVSKAEPSFSCLNWHPNGNVK